MANNTRYTDLDLDLSFHPIECKSPIAFTSAQIADFNENGYVSDIRLFDGEALDALQRRGTEEHAELESGLNPHIRIEWIHELSKSPHILDYVRDLLGPNVVCFISQFIDKLPGSDRQVLGHQDAAYFAVNAGSVNVWLAFEDADTENGCMHFIPGSHKLGALEVCDPSRDLNVLPKVLDRCVDQHGSLPIELRAGQAVFFSDLLIHISPPNTSARHRPALTLTYAKAETRPYQHPKARHEPILCSGENINNNWTLTPTHF